MTVGQVASFAPDYVKAKVSAGRILDLFDRVPEIDSYSTDGRKVFCHSPFCEGLQRFTNLGQNIVTGYWSVHRLLSDLIVGRLARDSTTRKLHLLKLLAWFLWIQDEIKGDIQFSAVNFSYPTRPNLPILQDLSIAIRRGQTVAFVGASGCGKSTSVSLIERFYNFASGTLVSR